MGKLDNKIAIVTGGGTGIGKNIALEFAKEGADVVVASRNAENLEKTAKEIKALSRRSMAIATDVRVKDQVQDMVKQTLNEFGQIDIMVNNAGISRRALIVDMPDEDWDDVIATNLTGTFYCIQAVARHMMERKYGKIINMSSGVGLNFAGLTIANYAASKAGITQLTRCAARELGPYNINVNAICPGLIQTTMYYRRRTEKEVEEFLEYNKKAAILNRLGTTQDVANLAVFLASDDSSFICGKAIPTDGGRIDGM
jgi:3-oxoacyl-[acyl-carrier protein] reductase